MAIEKLKRHKSPGIDQILAELINQGVEQLGIRRNCLRCGSSRLLYLFTRRVIKRVVVIIEAYRFDQEMLGIILGQNLLSSSLLSKNIKIKIYRTIILPVVLYGCETWSLTLREERRLRVFENRMSRTVFGPRRGEVTG